MIVSIIRLGFPLSIMQLGSSSLNIINTILITAYAVADLAILGGANGIFWFFQISLLAFLLPFDGLFPQENTKINPNKSSLLVHGFYISVLLSILGILLCSIITKYMTHQNIDSILLHKYNLFLEISMLSIPPLLFFSLIQKFWQSYFSTKIFSYISIVSCAVNFIVAYILLSPSLPYSLGAIGIAWATVATRLTSLFLAIIWSVYELKRKGIDLNIKLNFEFNVFLRIVKLGIPSSVHSSIEMISIMSLSYFSMHYGSFAMSANQLALTFSMATYPLYLGITSASATYIGTFFNDTGEHRIAEVIKSSYFLSVLSSLLISIIILAFAFNLSHFVDLPEETLKLAFVLIIFVAGYQFADCFQSVCAGILRGMVVIYPVLVSNFISYYFFGLIVFVISFEYLNLGYVSIWIGFFVGVNLSAIINITLVSRFKKKLIINSSQNGMA